MIFTRYRVYIHTVQLCTVRVRLKKNTHRHRNKYIETKNYNVIYIGVKLTKLMIRISLTELGIFSTRVAYTSHLL